MKNSCKIFLIGLITFVTVNPTFSQDSQGQPSEENIQQFLKYTSAVGKLLFENYNAFEKAKSVLINEFGQNSLPELYAGGPYDNGWAFSFGRLEDDGTFVIDYGVIVDGNNNVLKIDVFKKRREASTYHTLAARALLAVRLDFKTNYKKRKNFYAAKYRIAILPFPDGKVTGFASPKQTVTGVTLFGNSILYRISRKTNDITDVRRFHHTIMSIPMKVPENSISAMLIVPESPLPSPVDVLNTMERGKPLIVLAKYGVFRVRPDGSIEKLPEDSGLVQSLRESVDDN